MTLKSLSRKRQSPSKGHKQLVQFVQVSFGCILALFGSACNKDAPATTTRTEGKPTLKQPAPPPIEKIAAKVLHEQLAEGYQAIQQSLTDSEYDAAIGRFVESNLKKDFEGTLRWMLSLEPQPNDGAAWRALGRFVASEKPDLLGGLIEKATADGFAQELLWGSQGLGATNPELLWQLMKTERITPEFRATVRHTFLRGRLLKGGVAEMRRYWEMIPKTDPAYSERNSTYFQILSPVNFAEAKTFLLALPESEFNQNRTKSIVQNWPEAHILEASEWLLNLPGGDSKDAGAYTLAGRLAKSSPLDAAAWAAAISNAGLRAKSVREIAVQTASFDRKLALSIIEKSPLTPEEKLTAKASAGLK